jgi:hypothetical protein
MKKALTFLGVLVIIAALSFGGYSIYRAMTQLEAKVAEVDARAAKTIAEKDALIAAKNAENVVLRERDAAGEVEKATIRKERDEARRARDKAIDELKTAPPETVLAKTQGWLDTREIWLRSNAASQVEAVFSLAAFRTNAQALEDRAYLKFTLVPNMERDYAVQAGQLADVRTGRNNLIVIVAAKDDVITEKTGQIAVRDDAIKYMKKARLWRDVRNVGYGVLLDRVLSLVFHGK